MVKKHSLTKKQYYNMSIIMRQCLDYACEPELGIITENPFSRIKIKKTLYAPKPKPTNNSQVFLIEEQKKFVKRLVKDLKQETGVPALLWFY